jgi:superfamily I DNA/RNA helicase
LLVLAGAGSGKTRVITHRIARLVARGVPPKSIVALTFTNKAAGEMRARVAALLGKGGRTTAGQLTVATFHAFGLGALTREKTALGGTFTIFDQGDQLGVVKELMRTIDAGKRFDAAAVLARISNAKNAFLAAEELPEREGDEYDEITREVYPRYLEALRGFRAFDFDDLVCELPRLWEKRPEVLARWQDRYRFILVDEYQDTNRAQLAVLMLLAGDRKNVCAVGDDDQAIYGWRGADVRNILEFEEHFPGAAIIKLEQNYRSCAPVLGVANAVIAKRADSRYRKTLFTERAGGDKVQLVVAPDPDVEAAWVAKDIKRRLEDDRRRPRDIAVLYRSNAQSKSLEEALREQGVAHRVVGGQQFFERKEVKDVLAYLRVVVNPADEMSLRRIVNYPARGIGAQSVERLALHAAAQGWSLWQALQRVDALEDVSGAARDGCKALESAVEQTRRDLRAMPASQAALALALRIGLRADIDASSPSPQAAARRWGNVEALVQSLGRREAREVDRDPMRWLASFLQAMALESNEEPEDASDVATLSTLHGSKGLEFAVVYLAGCEEGLLPHARTLDARATDAAPADLEEERRLFYVGVTRARDALVLLRCKTRPLRGKLAPRTPSRFLADIPAELLDEHEIKEDPTKTVAVMEQSAGALLAALDALGR